MWHYDLTQFSDLPDAELHSLLDGIYLLRLPMSFNPGHINVYILDAEDGAMIIDTGNCNSVTREIWTRILQLPLCKDRVKYVYLTHGHPDHSGQAQWLCETTGATLLIAEKELDAVRNIWRASSLHEEEVMAFFRRWGIAEEQLPYFTGMMQGFRRGTSDLEHITIQTIVNHQCIDFGGRQWRVVLGAGHTPANACLYCEKEGLMFTGDHLLPRIIPLISIWWGYDNDPLAQYFRSLKELANLNIGLCFPAHGDPFDRVQERIAKIERFHHKRLRRALEFCQNDVKKANEFIEPVLGRGSVRAIISLVAGQVFALLLYLENRGLLKRMEGDVYAFKVAEGAMDDVLVN